MARIAGVDLPREKRVEVGLTYIFGIGPTVSKQILEVTDVNPDTRVKDLSENEISKLREYIEHHLKVEGDLRREVSLNIKRLVEIGCYRGVRHRRNLPVRGPHPEGPEALCGRQEEVIQRLLAGSFFLYKRRPKRSVTRIPIIPKGRPEKGFGGIKNGR